MEKAEKKALIVSVNEGIKGGRNILIKLLDVLIDECRQDLETRRGDDFLTVQGEVKGHRKLRDILMKPEKKS